jgi:succinate dehydrogenase / fumarate reductase membrane anchor subunit
MHQRITALALVPLTVWLVYSIVSLRGVPHGEFITWMQNPLNAVLLIFFTIAGFYHAALGIQVIIEDYIRCKCAKMALIIGQNLFFLGGAIACIYAILRIA